MKERAQMRALVCIWPMQSPFSLPPHPLAQKAAAEVIEKMHAYMREHPESELHRCGKMFGVLVYTDEGMSGLEDERYIAAFSAQLDGSYHHEGFVPPIYEMPTPPVGHSKEESQRLQRLLFANYKLLNAQGESKNLLEIFESEKPILSEEDFFGKSQIKNLKNEVNRALAAEKSKISLPPSGAGECCAPKLLQYAFAHGLTPVAMAEFWVGAPSHTDVRQEGAFYAPCSGKCVPILKHMLKGVDITNERVKELTNERPEVIYEDEWLMVVNKPAGLLSVPGKTEEPSAEQLLHAKAVHRLDQDTSGLLVLAKTPEVYKALQSYFQRRDILKRYEAVVKPNAEMSRANALNEPLALNDGVIDLPLLPNPYDRPRQMVDLAHGKPAITRYEIRERRADGTILVDFYPLTGRTHQLRVHAAHPDGLNAPILGDRLYGLRDERIRGLGDERMMLHAAEITFVHPITQEEMHFCIPSCF